MDKELENKVSDFIENQDREQLRRLMNMGEEEERESDAEWKRDYHYHSKIGCGMCRYYRGCVCSKHDAMVEETYSCDLYEEV